MLRTLAFLSLVAAVSAAPGNPADAARRSSCNAVVASRLAEIGVDKADIEKMFYMRQTQSRSDDEVVVGYNAWVDLKSCAGSVVIDLDTSCRIRQVYTRGQCTVPGL